MSSTAKITVTIVVILLVLGGVYWWLLGQQRATAPTIPAGGTSAAPTGAAALTNGNTNADLSQDLATIDAQANGFATDSASMDRSLNDQPVTQSQL